MFCIDKSTVADVPEMLTNYFASRSHRVYAGHAHELSIVLRLPRTCLGLIQLPKKVLLRPVVYCFFFHSFVTWNVLYQLGPCECSQFFFITINWASLQLNTKAGPKQHVPYVVVLQRTASSAPFVTDSPLWVCHPPCCVLVKAGHIACLLACLSECLNTRKRLR